MQGKERAVLDYVLTNIKLLSTITEMIIDENKRYGVFKLEKSRKTYSNHSALLVKLNLISEIEKQKKNRIITNCGYKKYRNKLTQEQMSGTLKKDTIQVSFDKWSEDVQNKIKEVEKILRQNPRKNINAIKKKEENAEKTILKQQMYM